MQSSITSIFCFVCSFEKDSFDSRLSFFYCKALDISFFMCYNIYIS
nr:MAG TPA: hypothetical protein [Caudoviricetes sp.]